MAYDVVVVGAGHNGLTAALRLARAGRRVLVVEGHERPGGLCRTEEFHPGYRVPGLLHDEGLVPPDLVASQGLDRHGLRLRDAPALFVGAGGNGGGLLLDRDPEKAARALAAVSAADAAAYREWRRFLGRVGGFVRDLLARVPPPISPASIKTAGDFWALGRLGLGLRRLGRRDMTELLRVAPMCVADWLNERFATPWLVEGLAAPAVAATFMGPWSAGTAGLLLLRECAAGRYLEGGPAALVTALGAAGRERGVEVRAGVPVERIRIASGRVAGVRLASGEEIDAPVVAASCDPRRTFLELLPPGAVETRLERQIENFRARGTTAKVHLALSGPLEVTDSTGGRLTPEVLRLGGGTVDHLERAFDAVKYRRFSSEPFLDVRVPTVADPALAPAGHHVVSILASFAPHDLEGGWTDPRREELGDAVVAALARHAPDVASRIVAREVLTPAELETRWSLTGGHLHHGEHALDQLFAMRPVSRAARYATPIPGLFLAGSGSHPGGGVTALPGWLAAGVILKSN